MTQKKFKQIVAEEVDHDIDRFLSFLQVQRRWDVILKYRQRFTKQVKRYAYNNRSTDFTYLSYD